jgi:hypothetical protein
MHTIGGSMRNTLVIVAVLALLVLVGCAQKAMPSTAAPATAEQAVADVSGDVAAVGGITDDLDTSDLNSLDQELSDVQALELQ